MNTKIILIIIILILASFVAIGENSVNDIKLPSIPKSQPCVTQSSVSGNIMGTISSGDCTEAQKRGFSSEEQKLVGTWKINGEEIYTFNEDRTGMKRDIIYGNIQFKWRASGGVIYTDAQIINNPMTGGMSYRLINNDKTLVKDNQYFDKSWW